MGWIGTDGDCGDDDDGETDDLKMTTWATGLSRPACFQILRFLESRCVSGSWMLQHWIPSYGFVYPDDYYLNNRSC